LVKNGADAKPSAEQIAKWVVAAFDMYSTAQMRQMVSYQRTKLKRTSTEMHAEMMEDKKQEAAKKAAEGARFGAIAEEQRKLKVPLRVSFPAFTRLSLAFHSQLHSAFTRLSLIFHSAAPSLVRRRFAARAVRRLAGCGEEGQG
jgi:hypothetical protein